MRVTDYFSGIDRVKTADNAESWLLEYGNKKLLAIRYQNMMAGVSSPKYDGIPKGHSNNNATEDKMIEVVDKRIPLKEDYDMTIQQLNKYRRVLRLNKFFYIVKQAEQIGGVAQIRNFKNEQKQLSLLQKKWGSEIVRIDNNNRSHNLTKEKNKIDFNPVIRVPIKGI